MTAIPPDAIEAASKATIRFLTALFPDVDAPTWEAAANEQKDGVRKLVTAVMTAALGDKYRLVSINELNSLLGDLRTMDRQVQFIKSTLAASPAGKEG